MATFVLFSIYTLVVVILLLYIFDYPYITDFIDGFLKKKE